ncbi:15592_t:CDS:2, partial [Entrophospora sp. SA101]
RVSNGKCPMTFHWTIGHVYPTCPFRGDFCAALLAMDNGLLCPMVNSCKNMFDILNQTIFNGKSFLDAGIDVDVDKSFANNVNPADDNRDLRLPEVVDIDNITMPRTKLRKRYHAWYSD